jgi:hypothetical protein
MFEEIAALITALALWKWPVVVVVGAVLYRVSVSRLIDRIAEFEMTWKGGIKGKTRALNEVATRVVHEARTDPDDVIEAKPVTKALPPAPVEGKADIKLEDMTVSAQGTVGPTRDQSKLDDTAREVATEVGRSPKAALLLLSADIERNLRELLAATGWLRGRRVTSIPVGIDMLAEQAPVSMGIREAVRQFSDVRNQIVHGRGVAESDVISAIDSGLKILAAIDAIPREVNVVYHPGADVFSDPDGEHPNPSVKALLVDTTGPTAEGTQETRRRVFATTRTDYKKGQVLSWEWGGRPFGESWYRHPDTGKIEYAWTGSLEFIGRPLDEIA